MHNLWPIEEAKRLLSRAKSGKTIVFETGYGPSGLPHIGTFGEVIRTQMVMKALKYIAPEVKIRLICFSDDLDGLRKIPDNIPNAKDFTQYLGYALTSVPDPFGTHNSYGEHMNAKLQEFLDLFGFEYEFKSATQCYQDGVFDKHLLGILQNYQEVMRIILPTLGPERQKNYSPFMPIKNGKVLQTEIAQVLQNTIVYKDEETGQLTETEVTGGKCKLQWKPDWGMRWAALGVDFEFHGKDLQPSAVLSSKICDILGAQKPELSVYELFLDHEGKKISKSKGNGLTIEEWLKYAPSESLAFFMFQNPKRAKRLYFDVIPKNVDDYMRNLQELKSGEFKNPIDFIQKEALQEKCEVSFSLLLNLACACNPKNTEILWGFLKRYNNQITKEKNKFLYKLTEYALNYYNDFVKPNKKYKIPDDRERIALKALYEQLQGNKNLSSGDDFQQLVYDVGKANGYQAETGRWFRTIYQVLFGQQQGPRIGSFIALYGVQNTVEMIQSALDKRQ